MMRWVCSLACSSSLADQASKWWILNVLDLPELRSVALLPVLNLTMVWNQGVTFGLLHQDGAEPVPGSSPPWRWPSWSALIVWMRRAERPLVALALGAIAGGAVGNVIDRVRFGAVVDFIHAHAFGWSWYVFNVADAAIVCGVAVLILDGLRPARPRLQAPGLRQ